MAFGARCALGRFRGLCGLRLDVCDVLDGELEQERALGAQFRQRRAVRHPHDGDVRVLVAPVRVQVDVAEARNFAHHPRFEVDVLRVERHRVRRLALLEVLLVLRRRLRVRVLLLFLFVALLRLLRLNLGGLLERRELRRFRQHCDAERQRGRLVRLLVRVLLRRRRDRPLGVAAEREAVDERQERDGHHRVRVLLLVPRLHREPAARDHLERADDALDHRALHPRERLPARPAEFVVDEAPEADSARG
mmetsp:Transcript_30608/g.94558  ORF Transcript_30608/g.94558 Transcript_30608/m.94558 type:complete len:249 (-) Transcript_30608:1692-2438(-)